jgi:Mg-chelatase subunit ChlD
MGLVYKTSNFADQRWQRHVDGSYSARDAVETGERKQSDFSSFAQDVHAAMYLPNDPVQQDDVPEWATDLLETAQELNEWHDLKKRCSRRSLAAGIATEKLLQALAPIVPTQPEEKKQDGNQDQGKPGGMPGGQGQGQPQPGQGQGDGQPGQGQPQPGQGQPFGQPSDQQGQGTGEPEPSDGGGKDDADLRHKLRQACRAAKDAVNEARESLEGMNQALGLPGTEVGAPEKVDNLDAERAAWEMIKNDPNMKRVLAEAGRMQRKAATKKRKQVSHGGTSVSGVTMGGNVNDVLPVELVGLASSNPMVKLETLQKVQQRRALSYKKRAKKSKSRGPVVVAVDRSSSMISPNPGRQTWANAAAISILTTATKQKRLFHLIDFNARVIREKSVPKAKKLTLAEILDVVSTKSRGGTEFNPPVARALDLVENSKNLRKADVIIITDGESDLDQAHIDRANKLSKKHGVSFYVICVGHHAEVKKSLGKIATKTLYVNAARGDDDKLAPVLNLEG